MKTKYSLRPFAITGLVATAFVTGIAFAQSGITVMFNGKPMTTAGRVINGQLYVPASAVAKSLGVQVVKRSNTRYELTKPGGTNQVGGTQGKIGDVLFTGGWRFQATKAYWVEGNYNYTLQPDWKNEPLVPNEGKKLLAVEAMLTNSNKTSEYQRLFRGNNALADMDGISHQLTSVDVNGASYESGRTATLLPGAKQKIVLLYEVPVDVRVKDILVDVWSREIGSPGVTLRIALPTELNQ